MSNRRLYDINQESNIQFWGNYIIYWALSGAYGIVLGTIFVSQANGILETQHLYEEYPFKEFECTINTTCITSLEFSNIKCAPEGPFAYGVYFLRVQATIINMFNESYTDWALYGEYNSTSALEEAVAELMKNKTVPCYYSDLPESVKLLYPKEKVFILQPYVASDYGTMLIWLGYSLIGVGVLIILISFPFKVYRASANGYPLMPCCDWHPKPIDVELVASCEINSTKKNRSFILPGINSFWSNRYKQL